MWTGRPKLFGGQMRKRCRLLGLRGQMFCRLLPNQQHQPYLCNQNLFHQRGLCVVWQCLHQRQMSGRWSDVYHHHLYHGCQLPRHGFEFLSIRLLPLKSRTETTVKSEISSQHFASNFLPYENPMLQFTRPRKQPRTKNPKIGSQQRSDPALSRNTVTSK